MKRAHQTRHTATGRDEAVVTPCVDRWFIYDVLIDYKGGALFHDALATAREICSTCPLWTSCLAENANEEWAKAIITNRSVRQRPVAA